MYGVCSWYLALKLRLVCPIYALWHVLHVILYIPLFFVYWDGGMFFLFYILLCRCGGSECYVYIGVLEQMTLTS